VRQTDRLGPQLTHRPTQLDLATLGWLSWPALSRPRRIHSGTNTEADCPEHAMTHACVRARVCVCGCVCGIIGTTQQAPQGRRSYARRFHPLLSIVTVIYLCHTGSCHEILRMETPRTDLDQLQENGFRQWLGAAAPTWQLSLFAHVRAPPSPRSSPPAAHIPPTNKAAESMMCTSCLSLSVCLSLSLSLSHLSLCFSQCSLWNCCRAGAASGDYVASVGLPDARGHEGPAHIDHA
jgi:hypothetical protein